MNAQSGFEKLSLHFLLTLKFSLHPILLIWCLKVNSSSWKCIVSLWDA